MSPALCREPAAVSSQIDPCWKRDFPVRSDEDRRVARREFTKLLGWTSLGILIGTFVAAVRRLWGNVPPEPARVPIASVDEVEVGAYKLFRHPTENDPCILLRLSAGQFVAFNQNCTHLSCPVHFNAVTCQLECPCHRGFFNAEDGRPLAGPPRKSLKAISVSVRQGQVWAALSGELG